MAFHRACSLDELWQGEMQLIQINGTEVLMVHTEDGKVSATQAMCPHQEVCLDGGELKGRTLTCKQHLWQFDVVTGKGLNPTHAELAIYPTRIEGDDVFVETDGVEPKYAHS